MFHVIVYVFIHVIYILEQAYTLLYILPNTWLCIPSKSFKLL